ncbi:hypothetical protein HanPSC8_Chr17g0795811 [Helianthus annuus]|nr:hypothetical protein HanPSC8_Chr17g0795811 [Helianthus annuus]
MFLSGSSCGNVGPLTTSACTSCPPTSSLSRLIPLPFAICTCRCSSGKCRVMKGLCTGLISPQGSRPKGSSPTLFVPLAVTSPCPCLLAVTTKT